MNKKMKDLITPYDLISVVIPCYNNSTTIRVTLQSVLSQSYQYLEILCIDDGSEENIKDIILSIDDSRIFYHRIPHNNANVARNYGIIHSRGSYIAMLDADDEWLETHLEDSLHLLDETKADGTYGSIILRNSNTDTPFITRQVKEQESIADFVLATGCGMQTSTLVMTTISAKSTLWDEKLLRHQDYDFVVRYSHKFTMTPLLKPTVIYYQVKKNKSQIDYASCIRFIKQNESDISPKVHLYYHETMLHRALSSHANTDIIEHYRTECRKHKQIDENLLQRIANHQLLHSACVSNTGLFSGKMGLVIFFFQYALHTQNARYEDIACELLDDIYEDLDTMAPIDLKDGLCGIGWGIEYLAHHKFIEGSTDEILEKIDSKIMERDPFRITDTSLETGLKGIVWYALIRFRSSYSHEPFDDTYKKSLEEACTKSSNRGTSFLLRFLQKNDKEEYPYWEVLYPIISANKEELSWNNGLKLLLL